MNGNMAANAFSAGLKTQSAMRNRSLALKSGMTLQAQLAALTANQQHAIGTAMRTVTGNATATVSRDFSRGMLIHERAVLFDMACRARFRNGLDQI